MSLRAKIAIVLASLAALAAVGIGAVSLRSTSSVLRSGVDESLARGVSYVEGEWRQYGSLGPGFGGPPADDDSLPRRRGGPSREFDGLLVQIIDRNGEILIAPRSGELPISDADRQLATSGQQSRWRDAKAPDGGELRIVTIPVDGGAVQLARSLDEVETVLRRLVMRSILTVLAVAAIAGLLGWWFARRLTDRLVALTAAAEQVTATGELGVAVPQGGTDEAGRLGTAISHMLGSLASSRNAQQRLVQDAGHELRTPLTSLRTNIAVLRRNPSIDTEQRAQLLDDLDSESRELTTLVNELVAAAAERTDESSPEHTVLRGALSRIAGRAERRTGRTVTLSCDDSAVEVRPGSLDRAVGNLLDNAAKFDDSTQPIELTAKDRTISVRDHGPGFDPADLAHVFDRFYRSTIARGRPGSGLGLSIVAEVVERHGGTVTAANHPGGGAIVTIYWPSPTTPPFDSAGPGKRADR
jgi:two-component system, OmpR family, sensor histidine kinase MprB